MKSCASQLLSNKNTDSFGTERDAAFLTLWREADSWTGEKGGQELGNGCQQSKRQRGEDRKDEASVAGWHNRWAELASRWRKTENVTVLEEEHHTYLCAEIVKQEIKHALLPPAIGTFLHAPAAQTSKQPLCAAKVGKHGQVCR